MIPLALLVAAFDYIPPSPTPVGRSVGLLFHSKGPELRARPNDDRRRPFVVQSVDARRGEGGFFYDIRYYGLDPGTHDLRDGLERVDGGPMSEVRPILVAVSSGLPAGHVPPAELPTEPGPRVGGYRRLLIAVGAVWAVGLLALVASFVLPRRRAAVASDRPVTLADRLRPLVAGAAAGTLGREDLAALERTLAAYWRTRRGWNDADPHAALRKLHADPEAGPLLAQLEAWLHQPTPTPPADLRALLAPYRAVPADAVDLPAGGSR